MVPEIWRGVVIDGEETGWKVSNWGRLRLKNGRLASNKPKKATGYILNKFGTKSHFRHILVAQAFLENPRPGYFLYVDHIDRDPLNNHVSNLRWVTKQLNSLNTVSKQRTQAKT